MTANADTVYYISFIDLSDGPMVVETPPDALGVFDDMWFHWIIDFGLPGPDRGAGGSDMAHHHLALGDDERLLVAARARVVPADRLRDALDLGRERRVEPEPG